MQTMMLPLLAEVSDQGFWEDFLQNVKNPWVALGVLGQAVFFTRFLVQWIASERQKRSVIPLSFWWISIAGSALVLLYGIQVREPIILLGQSCGMFIYIRNLVMIRAERLRSGAG